MGLHYMRPVVIMMRPSDLNITVVTQNENCLQLLQGIIRFFFLTKWKFLRHAIPDNMNVSGGMVLICPEWFVLLDTVIM